MSLNFYPKQILTKCTLTGRVTGERALWSVSQILSDSSSTKCKRHWSAYMNFKCPFQHLGSLPPFRLFTLSLAWIERRPNHEMGDGATGLLIMVHFALQSVTRQLTTQIRTLLRVLKCKAGEDTGSMDINHDSPRNPPAMTYSYPNDNITEHNTGIPLTFSNTNIRHQ